MDSIIPISCRSSPRAVMAGELHRAGIRGWCESQPVDSPTRQSRLPNRLNWMRQIASALKAASEAGIVHRDIKPENIMVTRNVVAKVTDFGLAQLAQQKTEGKMNLTQIGTTMGTPWYMSPEQIQGEKLDHRSDQYSLGVTCFHMFAAVRRFRARMR